MLSSIEMQRKQIQQESVGHVCIFRIAHLAPNQLHHRLRLHQGFPARYTTLSPDHHSSREAVLNVNVEVCRAAQPTLGLKIGDQILYAFSLNDHGCSSCACFIPIRGPPGAGRCSGVHPQCLYWAGACSKRFSSATGDAAPYSQEREWSSSTRGLSACSFFRIERMLNLQSVVGSIVEAKRLAQRTPD